MIRFETKQTKSPATPVDAKPEAKASEPKIAGPKTTEPKIAAPKTTKQKAAKPKTAKTGAKSNTGNEQTKDLLDFVPSAGESPDQDGTA